MCSGSIPTTRDVDLWKISNGQWAGSVNIGTHPAGYQPSLSGDFNGDGTSDILWYNPTTRAVDIWKIDTNGQWAGSVDVGTHPAGYSPRWLATSTATAPAISSGTIRRRATSTSGSSTRTANGRAALTSGPIRSGWQPLGAADFNLDGTDDIAWHNPDHQQHRHLADPERPVGAAASNIGSHPGRSVAVGVGDFDHNGVADIMWRDTGTGHIDNWMLAYS